MRRMMIVPVAVLLAGTAAIGRDSPSADADAKFATRMAGFVAGSPRSCIPQKPSPSLEAIGPRLLYKVNRRLIYVNDTGGGCENVARGDALVTQSNSGRLCSGDVGTTVDIRGTGATTGGCALGKFVPYTRN